MADSPPLAALVRRFVDAFNRCDLEGVMGQLTTDAVYDELTGRRNVGEAAIREAFTPQFRGDYGALVFDEEDLFIDEAAGKALVSWTCRIQGRPGGWRGLDILVFRDGLICEKRTYTKADVPKIERGSVSGAPSDPKAL